MDTMDVYKDNKKFLFKQNKFNYIKKIYRYMY